MQERKFNVGCELSYSVSTPSVFVFNIEVSRTGRFTIEDERLELPGGVNAECFILGDTGNRMVRLKVEPGEFTLRYAAAVARETGESGDEDAQETPVEKLPPETLTYLFPSRYCQSDKLMRLAQRHFGSMTPGFGRVQEICDWIHGNVEYLHGSTDARTSAFDTVTERAGVCRDFAHLGIAFCRSLNIPARFVTGYAYRLEPPDFHAYFEAFLGGRWYAFDASRLVPREGLIRIGAGADASQASFANIFGTTAMTGMNVYALRQDVQDRKV